jgi:hypothetical protein
MVGQAQKSFLHEILGTAAPLTRVQTQRRRVLAVELSEDRRFHRPHAGLSWGLSLMKDAAKTCFSHENRVGSQAQGGQLLYTPPKEQTRYRVGLDLGILAEKIRRQARALGITQLTVRCVQTQARGLGPNRPNETFQLFLSR